MADPSGVQAALAVEAVEWEPAEGGKLTVRVRGRWRRRRPEWRGQPVLAIEAEGSRHRFPATPEPPSLTGVPPGSWQMTFSVPAWLAPYLGGRIWLQLGLAVIPLPAPVAGEPSAADRPEVDTEVLSDRRARSAEITADRWRAQHAEAEALANELTIRMQELEQMLEEARREPERLRKLIADRDQQRRAAEQRAHAERALRAELEEALDAGEREARDRARIEAGELATAEARVRELEDEVDELRLRLASAAAEGGQPPPAAVTFDLRDELAVAATPWPVTPPGPALALAASVAAAERGAEYRALAGERRLAPSRSPTAARAQPGVPSPTEEDPELTAVLLELRSELEQLTQIAERERAGRFEAERRVAELERRVAELERSLRERELRSARAFDAVHELRTLLELARGERGGTASWDVEPERFDEALSRLRAGAPKPPDDAEGPTAGAGVADSAPVIAWLAAAFERLTAADPDRAGRLLVGLLPAQGAVYSEPVAYDLVLDAHECVQLTLRSGGATPEIVVAQEPRDVAAITFQVNGDHAALARLLTAGRFRARFGRGVARVSGDRHGLTALRALVRHGLSLEQLYDAGVRLDPELAFSLAAAMVRPEWTGEERFTVAQHEGAEPSRTTYLNVRGGEPMTVIDAPPDGPVAATIVCPDDELLAVLAGELRGGAVIHGDASDLLALLGWLERAQRE
jgi:TolA-binding protein